MKQTNFLKSLFLLFALIVGSVSAWADPTTLFHETFGNNTSSARNWNNSYSVKSGESTVYSGASYTVTDAKQSRNTMGQTQSALVSGSDATGVFIVGPLNVSSYESLEVTNYFGMSSGTWNSTNSYMKLSYSIDNETYTEVTRTGSNPTGAVNSNKNFVQASYSLPAAAQSSTLYLKFEFYCYQLNSKSQKIGQAYFDEVELIGVSTSSDPSISLSSSSENVTAAEGDGTINVTYTNIDDVDAEVLYYESDGATPATYDWIIADINASNNLEYMYEANTGAARTAYMKVHQKNTDVYSSLITIAQGGVYTVTYETAQENGTLVIKNGDDVVTSDSKLAAGTILTIETTPAENYVFRNWQYKKGTGSWQTKTANFEYTMDENDVEFRANFDLTYPVNFIVNGQIASTARFAKDKKIDFPGSVTEYDGYSFIGWTETPVVGTVAVEPTLVNTTTETMGTEEKTYYAVYAKTSTKDVTVTFDASDISNLTSTGDRKWKDNDSEIELYISAGQHYTSDTPNTWTVNKSSNSNWNYLSIGRENCQLKKVTVTTVEGYGVDEYYVYENITDEDGIDLTSSVETVGTTSTLTLDDDYEQVVLWASTENQIRATEIEVEATINYISCYVTTLTKSVTISAAKYATFASDSDLDFSGVEGLYAYTATVADNKITFNRVTKAKEGEGLLLYANVNEPTIFNVPVATDSPEAVASNKLVRGEDTEVASTYDEGATYNYVLSNNGGEVNFYRAAGKKVATNKAYLKNIPAGVAGAKFFLPTGDEEGEETDGIKSVQGSRFTVNGEAYNLAGQKVGADYKGIVIVNGKKVIRK